MEDFQLFLKLQAIYMSAIITYYVAWQCSVKAFLLIFNPVAAEHLQLTMFALLWGEKKFRLQFQPNNKIPSPYPLQLGRDLDDLAMRLAPSDQYMKEGRAMANTIFNALKRNAPDHGFKIGRTRIAGSFGKGTGVVTLKYGAANLPDLDLVVTINDHNPPSKKIYWKFKKILKTELKDVHRVRIRRHSMKFTISTPSLKAINVDLLASPNVVQEKIARVSFAKKDVGSFEAMEALMVVDNNQRHSIEENQEIDLEWNKLYSSSFTARTVSMIKSLVRDPYVLKVVRLAKKWNSEVKASIPYEYFPARSCMIELIAIYAQEERGRKTRGRNGGQRCLVCGFKRFLDAVSNLKTLRLSLGEVEEFDLEAMPAPVVCDPVNAWNNYAQGLDPYVINVLVDRAKMTLETLERYRPMTSAEYRSVENATASLLLGH